MLFALSGCATTGSVKRAQGSADVAGTAAQRAQRTAEAAGTSAQSANDAAGRAQNAADAAAAAARGASSAGSSTAQSMNARLDDLMEKVTYLEKRERARQSAKRHKPPRHRRIIKKSDPSPFNPPYQKY